MRRSSLGLVLALLLVLAACSGGSDDAETSTVSETPSATPEEAVSPEPAASASTTASPTPTREIDMDSPAFTEDSTISTVGLDEVFFGMTAEAAAVAAGTAWETDTSENPECWFATPVNGPDGVRLMIWESTVERIDVATEGITTRSGAGVGSTAEELRVLFGERLVEDDPSRLAFVPADEEDAEFRIIFDMVDGVVAAFRAGRLPMIELAGCS